MRKSGGIYKVLMSYWGESGLLPFLSLIFSFFIKSGKASWGFDWKSVMAKPSSFDISSSSFMSLFSSISESFTFILDL